jgi:D-glycero-beta-D-manno-heptose-7-phosphate kinase
LSPKSKQVRRDERAPDLARLLEIISAFGRQTISVLGDFIVDEYVTGEISRVSREAPVLILRHRKTELLPGGGANAVNNLVDLGARVRPIGAIGEDAAGKALLEYFKEKNLDISGIVRVRGWATTTKTRYLARWTHTACQQVLRFDRQSEAPLGPNNLREIARKARTRVANSDAVLVSDYGVGSITPQLLKGLRLRIATLDSRHRLLEYRGLKILAATPNEPELEGLYHTQIGEDDVKLQSLGAKTRRAMGLEALLVTRGKDGMVLFERGNKPYVIAPYGAKEAVDVTGAGDTVIAVFTLALAARASFAEAAHLANYAGGIVVMKSGTATLTPAELESAVRGEITERA